LGLRLLMKVQVSWHNPGLRTERFVPDRFQNCDTRKLVNLAFGSEGRAFGILGLGLAEKPNFLHHGRRAEKLQNHPMSGR